LGAVRVSSLLCSVWIFRSGDVRAELEQLVVVRPQVAGPVVLPELVEFLDRLELVAFHVQLGEDRRQQRAAGVLQLNVSQVLGLPRVDPEAAGHQDEDPGAEQEPALSFQAGLAEQPFERAVGHVRRS
jgi:hypothetical protein